MKPIRTEDSNAVLKLPGGTDENDLPCRIENGWTLSTWEMNNDENALLREHGRLVVWIWWPNLLGVSVKVGDSEKTHTEVDMAVHQGQDDEGDALWTLVATLDEEELLEVRAGARIHLGVDMHPTCPVAMTADNPEAVETAA